MSFSEAIRSEPLVEVTPNGPEAHIVHVDNLRVIRRDAWTLEVLSVDTLLGTPTCLKPIPREAPFQAGAVLCAVPDVSQVNIFYADGQKTILRFGDHGVVEGFFLSTGHFVAYSDFGLEATVWEIGGEKPVLRIPYAVLTPAGVAVSPSGQRLACLQRRKQTDSVIVFDLPARRRLTAFTVAAEATEAAGVAFRGEDQLLVWGSKFIDHTAIFDISGAVEAGRDVALKPLGRYVRAQHRLGVSSAALSPRGSVAALGYHHGDCVLLLETLRVFCELTHDARAAAGASVFQQHGDRFEIVAFSEAETETRPVLCDFSRSGKFLLTRCAPARAAWVWAEPAFAAQAVIQTEGPIVDTAWSPHSDTLALLSGTRGAAFITVWASEGALLIPVPPLPLPNESTVELAPAAVRWISDDALIVVGKTHFCRLDIGDDAAASPAPEGGN
eukprot:gnl/Chilomastix_cuspidata/3662.p1 GENE.gnl/Chilomastix_cuspidata/3662~~gnl/Chilomastix_cuspidata/3662.p1  ORF type:complete len:442 (-),score=129.24 gnl/Chilomastix_cuspidata/3662:354-1679(-)